MLTVDEALKLVLSSVVPLSPRRIQLMDALGGRLAEPIVADRDSPPFPKVVVDGYAVRSSEWSHDLKPVKLAVLERIPAGMVPSLRLSDGQATQIMTGAPLPEGADAVVMREYADYDGSHVTLSPLKRPVPGSHWMPQGHEVTAGSVVASAGSTINAVRLGLLATFGATQPKVWPRVRVAILSTGDELVPPESVPGPGQIRNSNSVMLQGLVEQAGGQSMLLTTARDEANGLFNQLKLGLDPDQTDILLVSGGVSAGTHDLVPGTLEQLGVQPIFHKVRLKPGKPLFFGIQKFADRTEPILVFGLPGNPVSVLVGFLVFVLPALKLLGSCNSSISVTATGQLTARFSHRGDRPTYYPCRKVVNGNKQPQITPLAWAGSADLITISNADAFAIFPGGDRDFEIGETVTYLDIPGRD